MNKELRALLVDCRARLFLEGKCWYLENDPQKLVCSSMTCHKLVLRIDATLAQETAARQVPVTEAGKQDVGIREDAKLPADAAAHVGRGYEADINSFFNPCMYKDYCIAVQQERDTAILQSKNLDYWKASSDVAHSRLDAALRENAELKLEHGKTWLSHSEWMQKALKAEAELAALKAAMSEAGNGLPGEYVTPWTPYSYDPRMKVVESYHYDMLRQSATAQIAALRAQLAEVQSELIAGANLLSNQRL